MDFDSKPKHAAPDDQTSSQGCQNIPISLYLQFLYDIQRGTNSAKREIPYMILDSSKIKKASYLDEYNAVVRPFKQGRQLK